MGIVSVTLLPTNAFFGWVTENSRNFNNAYEGASSIQTEGREGSHQYIDDTASNTTGYIYAYAYAKSYWIGNAMASRSYTFDSSIQGASSATNGVPYEIYRAYSTYYIDASISGSNAYVEVTVKLIYFSGAQVTARSVTTKYTGDVTGTITLYTPSYTLGSIARNFYVEVSLKVYARSAFGDGSSTVDMIGTQYLHLQNWGIQRFANLSE